MDMEDTVIPGPMNNPHMERKTSYRGTLSKQEKTIRLAVAKIVAAGGHPLSLKESGFPLQVSLVMETGVLISGDLDIHSFGRVTTTGLIRCMLTKWNGATFQMAEVTFQQEEITVSLWENPEEPEQVWRPANPIMSLRTDPA